MSNIDNVVGIVGATIGIGQYIINDYVITIAEAEGDYGYTMTITRGSDTQTVTLYGLSSEQYDAMLGYLEAAQTAAQNSASSANTAATARNAAQSARNAAQSARDDAQSASETSIQAANAAITARNSALTYANNAQTAANTANSARSGAEAARSAAVSAKTAAESAATRAETAAGQITGMTAEAETLAPGSEATASFLDGVLSLGIPAGATGPTGADGNGIVSITKTGTQGNVDTYTITMTDGSTSTFTVTNGTDGAVLSVAGKTGAVTLDAGDVEYDDTDTYAAGSVGAGLADLKSQIEEISQSGIDASGASDGQVPVADGQGSWAWDDPAGGGVSDVQVNGVSVVSDGVANVPVANASTAGVIKVNTARGLSVANDGTLQVSGSNLDKVKAGTESYAPITPYHQHEAAFYGMAKAAGDSTQSASANVVGQYTESAKSAISEMLNGSVTVTGATPSITALPGVRYVCSEVSTIDITVPVTGIIDVVFTSGATPAVLTVTPPTGMTMRWANGFDPTSLDANTVYEINIMDGSLGVTGTWT